MAGYSAMISKMSSSYILLSGLRGSLASAHRLRSGLVRKAPREGLSVEDWMVFRRFMVDLHDWLYIGDP